MSTSSSSSYSSSHSEEEQVQQVEQVEEEVPKPSSSSSSSNEEYEYERTVTTTTIKRTVTYVVETDGEMPPMDMPPMLESGIDMAPPQIESVSKSSSKSSSEEEQQEEEPVQQEPENNEENKTSTSSSSEQEEQVVEQQPDEEEKEVDAAAVAAVAMVGGMKSSSSSSSSSSMDEEPVEVTPMDAAPMIVAMEQPPMDMNQGMPIEMTPMGQPPMDMNQGMPQMEPMNEMPMQQQPEGQPGIAINIDNNNTNTNDNDNINIVKPTTEEPEESRFRRKLHSLREDPNKCSKWALIMCIVGVIFPPLLCILFCMTTGTYNHKNVALGCVGLIHTLCYGYLCICAIMTCLLIYGVLHIMVVLGPGLMGGLMGDDTSSSTPKKSSLVDEAHIDL